MSWFDHQEKAVGGSTSTVEPLKTLKVHMPGAPDGVFVDVSKFNVKRKYKDEVGPRLLIVIDEVAELLQPTGVKDEEHKEIDQIKQEIHGIIQSITQLGRSSGIHMILCTQRNDTSIISGVIQANPLDLNTLVEVRTPFYQPVYDD